MGQNKSLLKLGPKSLIEYVVEALKSVTQELVVVLGYEDDPQTYGKLLGDDVIFVRDIEGGFQGPVMGIVSGLKACKSDYVSLLPCDAPFVRRDVISFLFDCAEGFDAAVPRWANGRLEAVHAVYKVKTTLEAALESLQACQPEHRPGPKHIINRLKRVNFVNMEKIASIDKDLLTFMDLDTIEDLEKARNRVEAGTD